jgi:hypothetical protein
MDLLSEVAKMFGLGAGATVVLGVGVYFFKESFAAALSRSVNRDLENLRSDLSEKLEKVRHQLEREAHKAELVATKKHEVYPEAFEKFRATYRTVCTAVAQSGPYFRVGDRDAAHATLETTKEYLLLKSLHFGPEVRKQAKTVLDIMGNGLRILDPNHEPWRYTMLVGSMSDAQARRSAEAKAAMQSAERALFDLQAIMQAELSPDDVSK